MVAAKWQERWHHYRHAELCEEHGDGRTPGVAHGPGYLYRPRQILIGTSKSDWDKLAAELTDRGGTSDDDLNQRLAKARLPVHAYLMPAKVSIPELVTELRGRRRPGEPVPAVAPNHVLCGEGPPPPDYHGGPYGDPSNAQSLDEAPYSKPATGLPAIAVLDTGYDPAVLALHPGLAWRVGYNPADEENAIGANGYLTAEGGHGTFVDGVIMRVAQYTKIQQVRVLDPAGVGDDAGVALGIASATTPVINLSLGGYAFQDVPPLATAAALEALPADVAVVAAAGNNNSSRKFFPAADERVIAVGAVDTSSEQLGKACFSNYGGWVQVYLPGVGVRSTYLRAVWKQPSDPQPIPIDGTARWSGTSFCAPQFAALVADGIPQAGSASQAAQAVLATARPQAGLPAVLIPQPGVID